MKDNNKVRNLVELMVQIKRRPAMFLGDNKLTSLHLFLTGYKIATDIHESENNVPATKNFFELHSFVEMKLNVSAVGRGWRTLILDHCNGDEEKALEMFFDLFEEFVKEQETKNTA